MLSSDKAKRTFRAYLYVLGESEFQCSGSEIIGCLMNATDFLSDVVRSKGQGCEEETLLRLIEQREKVNGRCGVNDPELISITTKTVAALRSYLSEM